MDYLPFCTYLIPYIAILTGVAAGSTSQGGRRAGQHEHTVHAPAFYSFSMWALGRVLDVAADKVWWRWVLIEQGRLSSVINFC